MDKDDYRAPPATAGNASDGPRPVHVQALVGAWIRLSGRLVPLIGENGFSALFGRTLRLSGAAYPWLSLEPSRRTSATLLAGLESDLGTVEETVAAAVNDELMSTFTRQLGALIGAALTARLLAETAADDEQQQNQQEQKE